MTLTIRSLSPQTWAPYADFIAANNGVWGGCWCLVFHAGTKGGSQEERRARKQAMVEDDATHAALVCDGDSVVGWAQYGRTEELSEIRCRRQYDKTRRPEDPDPDWRITCFFIDKAWRRRGVAGLVLDGALVQIADAGGGWVEAYPEVLEGQKTAAGFLWGGTMGLFERAGFEPVRKIAKHRWVVRRYVERAQP